MFGFLSAPCRQCAPQDAATFQSYFCGLSNTLSADYGPAARFLVNRDSAFVSLLGGAQMKKEPRLTASTCCNPIGKTVDLAQGGELPSFVAAVTVSGMLTKLRDDEADQRGLRRVIAMGLSRCLGEWEAKASGLLQSFEFPVDRVRKLMGEQEKIEREIRTEGRSPWEAAAPTKEAFGEILQATAAIAGRKENVGPLRKMGEALGGLVYACDATTDLEKDRKGGSFNPLLQAGGTEGLSGELKQASEIREAEKAVQLERHQEVVAKVLESGIERVEGGGETDMGWQFAAPKKKKKKKDDSWCDFCVCGGCGGADFCADGGASSADCGCPDCGCDCGC